MPLSESDTRAKLIDPALHARGWKEDLIRREETAGAVEILEGRPHKRSQGRTDYTLRIKVTSEAQPVAVALIEAKAGNLPPGHGLEQAKLYAECKRLNVPFVIATNGHQFVLYDRITGITDKPKPMTEIPTPAELRAAYESGMGFSLESQSAKPLLVKYQGGEATRRYYQDAAIRAVLEHIAKGEKRALLSLATGAGKTFIAVHLLKRIADAGLLRRALFICDRDELRGQGLAAMQNVFGADAAEVYRNANGDNNAKNARIHIATYQTLGVDSDEGDANFLTENYPVDFFSHIIIDECHRSAWGKWSQVLTRNPNAVQVGLTATPRQLTGLDATPEDAKITADNLKYFGEPVYEYEMAQGMEDGYLAACEVIQRDIFLDKKTETEQVTGVQRDELDGKEIRDAITGEALSIGEVPQQRYEAGSFEGRLMMPDRVSAMCKDLFNLLVESGGPEQKTIIFCAKDSHADRVAVEMNNLYRDWRAANGLNLNADNHYAFKCTAASSGNHQLPDLRGSSQRYFVACTVDLLTTGVDVPIVRNVVFFKYVRSSIAFYEMVGRGVWRYGKRIGDEGRGGTRPIDQQIAVSVPAIITREIWELAQECRDYNSRIAKRKMKREYLLRSLIYCGCGRRMAGGSARSSYYYHCRCRYANNIPAGGELCHEPLVKGKLIECVTWDYIMGLITNPEQFEQKLREAQAQEAEAMQPKQRELDHVLALLDRTETEADEIARVIRKTKGIVRVKTEQ